MENIIQNINDFYELELEEKLEYINNLILITGSLNKACKTLGVKTQMIKKLFKKKGYEFNGKSQIFEVGGQSRIDENIKDNIRGTSTHYKKKLNATMDIIEGGKYTPNDVQHREVHEKIIDIINDYDILKLIINNYKTNATADDIRSTQESQTIIKVVTGIKINLPSDENMKTSIRVNKIIWAEFKDFMNKHKEYSNTDILSSALQLYMKTYDE